MGGPGSGKFVIKLASGPQPLVGVDLGGAPVAPVLTDGSDNIVSSFGFRSAPTMLVTFVQPP